MEQLRGGVNYKNTSKFSPILKSKFKNDKRSIHCISANITLALN